MLGFIHTNFEKVDRDVDTQIGRALEQLGSKALSAGSLQAKGKIKRPWLTLQNRRAINRTQSPGNQIKIQTSLYKITTD